jgi:membrane-bound serine protease (ClpP class)
MKINTPGGLEQSMREIVQETLNSPIPTIAFVAPKGARAASAGAFIVIACHVTAMAPGTTIGAAHPVSGQGTDIGGNLDKKITNDTAAFMRSLAQQRGRDVKWSEEAVTKSLSVNENEALKKKLVDFVADDLDQLLAKLDGREITLNGVTHKLDLKRARLIHIALTLREKFFHMLAHPELAYILLSLGTLGLIFELQSPHGVSGPIGAICLVLALISLSILPFNAGGLLMMILAIGLFIADVKLNTHGILSLIGVTCLLFGSFMLFSPMEPFWRVSRLFIFAWVGLTAFAFGTIVYLGIKAQLKGASVGREILPGATGVAMTGLKPEGIVHVMGEEWSAHLAPGADSLHKGDRVRVISIDGLKLTVEPADNSGTPTNKGRT